MHLEAAGVADLVGPADEHDGDAELVGRPARRPSTISPGALSPPMASTAMGRVDHRASGVDQSTSMAWRPWYQPQLPHTTWGSLTAPQRGQVLRAGCLERPGRGPAAAALGLGGLLLGDGHAWFLVVLVCGIGGEPGTASGPTDAGAKRARVAGAKRAGSRDDRGSATRRRRPRTRSSSRAAQRGSRSGGLGVGLGRSSSTPVGNASGAGPGQSSAHSGASGRASSTASRTIGSRSTCVAAQRVGLALGRVGLEDLA